MTTSKLTVVARHVPRPSPRAQGGPRLSACEWIFRNLRRPFGYALRAVGIDDVQNRPPVPEVTESLKVLVSQKPIVVADVAVAKTLIGVVVLLATMLGPVRLKFCGMTSVVVPAFAQFSDP